MVGFEILHPVQSLASGVFPCNLTINMVSQANIKTADPVLNRLIQAVNSLRDNNARGSQAGESANQESKAENGTTETTESAVKWLFPSTRGTPCSGPTATTHASFNVNSDYVKSCKKGLLTKWQR